MKKQYAIIGKYGVGKTTLLQRVAALGYQVLDADAFFKICYLKNQPCYEAISKTFGSNFVNETEVDRTVLRQMLSNDLSTLDLLEKTVYPFLEAEIQKKAYDFVEIANVYSPNANFIDYFDSVFELVNTEKFRQKNIASKNVDSFVSTLNNVLNKNIEHKNNIIIEVSRLQNDTDLKIFLEKLF